MTSQRPDHRLPSRAVGVVAGELITAACFGLLGLFSP